MQSGNTKTVRASWNGAVLVESSDIVELEGKTYFPFSAINK